ncbi:interferon-induced protein with tetratricopeptide repeats 1-like [Cheilinus undulatus]|uniref:interferon-induced protein with tetratricopeptide repeats 1-like n=1 Tax=Cheilinus undulatus TaxID=241271 RepID=UPI001BD540DF|nr:interferon-induced protein with tetratricopeptide repeats 1-like [Cheilinus undulatus]
MVVCAAQSLTTLESLQCHFTWDLDRTRSILLLLRDKMEDNRTEEGNRWLGHIYNLWGFIQYKLGVTEDAKRLFQKAAEAFSQIRRADEGPWLVVNYGNMAWLHHHLGEQEESQNYLSKVDDLVQRYPSPSKDELHPEIYAEKAWSLTYLREDMELSAEYFEKAARLQPDMVEWNTSYVLALADTQKYSYTGVDADLFEKMRLAKEQDPESLYLAIVYLEQRAKKGETIEDEVRELARNNLSALGSSHSCARALLRVYRHNLGDDEAIALAEEALQILPDRRYLKRYAALCYRHKLLGRGRPGRGVIDRAISLHQEVLSLYPFSLHVKKIDLATIYAKASNMAEAEQLFQELLQSDLNPKEKQTLYNAYAKYRDIDCNDLYGSIQYHMKAAAIPEKSFHRDNSIKVLEKKKNKGKMSKEIENFLKNLQEPKQ